MGRAMHGGTCPLCRQPVCFTAKGKLYRHRGSSRALVSGNRLPCRAGGHTRGTAQRMADNQAAGRHPHRNEDGTWIKEGE